MKQLCFVAPTRAQRVLEVALLAAVPVALAASMALGAAATAVAFAVVLVAVALLLASFARSSQPTAAVMATVALAAVAAAARILCAPVASLQPVTALVILAGILLGSSSGFAVGALAAFASNLVLGMGMWCPWQMFAWGLIGYVAGAMPVSLLFSASKGRMAALAAVGVVAAGVYALFVNGYYVLGYVRPLTWAALATSYVMALPFDAIHAVSTVVFLEVLAAPLSQQVVRVLARHGVVCRASEKVRPARVQGGGPAVL
jgi:energy-coupling factor transport system substrate-specific component